jgi:hypothetical protein
MGLVARVCQPSTLRMLIWPEASKAQNNIAAVSADSSTVWVLIRRLNSSCNRSRVKVRSLSPASLRLSATAMLEPPFADEALSRFDLLARRRVDV